MAPIAPVDSSLAQAAAAAASPTTASATQSQADAVSKLGLPPASLAAAAATNTVNAELATSQWGVDPNTVGGVYGGAADSSSVFSGGNLLPLLRSISPATAEQALALIGVQSPSSNGVSSGATNAAAAAAASASANAKTLFAQGSSGSGPMVVDPLWGKSA